MFGTILVPLDGSPLADRAIPYAMRLAKEGRGCLILIRAVDPADDKIGQAEFEDARSQLARLASELRARGATVDQAVYRDLPFDAIKRAVHWYNPDLILMSTHARGEVARWYRGSVADEVIRDLDIPVLLIPPPCQEGWPELPAPEEVLVPLDGSEFAAEALGPAAHLARALGCRLTLFYVARPALRDQTGQYLAEDDPAVRAAAARQLLDERVASLRGDGVRAEVDTAIGYPETLIPHRGAAPGVAAIAIATHARGGLERTAMGSTATATLLRACTPLLVVRPAAGSRMTSNPADHEPDDANLSISVSPAERKVLHLALVELLDRLEPAAPLAGTAEGLLVALGRSAKPTTNRENEKP